MLEDAALWTDTLGGKLKVTYEAGRFHWYAQGAYMGLVTPVGAFLAGRLYTPAYEANYTFDATRNLETSRTEANGTPSARTITTQWHPTLRLPIDAASAAPKRSPSCWGSCANGTADFPRDTV